MVSIRWSTGYYAVVDRTAVTGTVWLGLTVGCAQCHTHKFDPISQKEYFGLFAFLNNADEPRNCAVHRSGIDEEASRDRSTHQETGGRTSGQTSHHEAGCGVRCVGCGSAAATWLAVKWIALKPSTTEAGPTKLTLQPDGSIFAGGDAQKRDLYTLTIDDLRGAA